MQVKLKMQTIVEVVFGSPLSRCALSSYYHELFIHRTHFTLYFSPFFSSCSLYILKTILARENCPKLEPSVLLNVFTDPISSHSKSKSFFAVTWGDGVRVAMVAPEGALHYI